MVIARMPALGQTAGILAAAPSRLAPAERDGGKIRSKRGIADRLRLRGAFHGFRLRKIFGSRVSTGFGVSRCALVV